MKKFDKRVFNSLDALIIFAFLLLFVFLAVKNIAQVTRSTEVIDITVTAEKVYDGVIPEINEGDKIYTASGDLLGTVKVYSRTVATETYADTRVDTSEQYPLVPDKEVPEHSRLVFVIQANAENAAEGYSVNGVDIKVNRDFEFLINGFTAKGYFSAIDTTEVNEGEE